MITLPARREASLEQRGTDTQCFYACLVLGSRLAFFRVFAPSLQFAGRSNAKTYCLAAEESPLDARNEH
jgi:hypothetical protein